MHMPDMTKGGPACPQQFRGAHTACFIMPPCTVNLSYLRPWLHVMSFICSCALSVYGLGVWCVGVGVWVCGCVCECMVKHQTHLSRRDSKLSVGISLFYQLYYLDARCSIRPHFTQ